MINEILDHPEVFKLKNNDQMAQFNGYRKNKKGKAPALADIWQDQLHLTPEVHTILAERLVEAFGF